MQLQSQTQPHFPNVFTSLIQQQQQQQQQQPSFPLQQDTYTLSSSCQTENELKLKSKLSSKKEKIKQLKSELSSIKSENEALKAQINELKLNQNKKDNNNHNNILTNYNSNTLVDELQMKVNLLEIENEAKTKKIQQLETIKNEELSLMNQKIKDFEVVIDENSANYVKDIAQYKTQIDNYKMKLLHYEKYVDVVNFFISKVNLMLQLNVTSNTPETETNGVYDINELQNVLIQIETFINETIHSNNYNYNMNIPPSSSSYNTNQHIDKQEQEGKEKETTTNHINNDNNTNNVNNNSQNDELFYKTLEERLCLLETKMLNRTNSTTRTHKKSNSNKHLRFTRNSKDNIRTTNNNNNNKGKHLIKSKSLNKKLLTKVNKTVPYNNNNTTNSSQNIKHLKKKKQLTSPPLQSPFKKNKNIQKH